MECHLGVSFPTSDFTCQELMIAKLGPGYGIGHAELSQDAGIIHVVVRALGIGMMDG